MVDTCRAGVDWVSSGSIFMSKRDQGVALTSDVFVHNIRTRRALLVCASPRRDAPLHVFYHCYRATGFPSRRAGARRANAIERGTRCACCDWVTKHEHDLDELLYCDVHLPVSVLLSGYPRAGCDCDMLCCCICCHLLQVVRIVCGFFLYHCRLCVDVLCSVWRVLWAYCFLAVPTQV